MNYYIESVGKGGSTSSGNWHIHFNYLRKDSRGRVYTARESSSHFTKKAMIEWLNKMQAGHNVIMPNNNGIQE